MLALADGRILTGRRASQNKLIDAVGGEAEAIAWLETDKAIEADLPVVDLLPAASRRLVRLSAAGSAGRRALRSACRRGPDRA